VCVPSHYGMAHLQATSEGSCLNLWRVSTIILNTEQRTAKNRTQIPSSSNQ